MTGSTSPAWFDGRLADDLCVVSDIARNHPAVTYVTGTAVTRFDREARTVCVDDGRLFTYDHLVLATGSSPFVPPTPNLLGHGTFVYRTIEDLEAISGFAPADHRGDCRANRQ